MEKLNSCPLCNATTLIPFIQCEDYSISKETFSIEQCTNCGFHFTNPRPTPEEIGKYYQSDLYISHHANKTGLIPWLYRIIRNKQFVNKTNIIKKHLNRKIKLLDIGCGTGDFLNYSKSLGWDVVGVEPDSDARLQATTKSLPIHPLEYLNATNDKFDVITMWHVLEHVHNLDERIAQLNNLLTNDGIVIIAVPNLNSEDATFYQKYWAAYDLPRHLSHFSKHTITQLLKKEKFKLIDIVPMKYDAYYVSIKSEEYQKKKSFLAIFNGFISGFKSNRSAIKTKEYSSLIYVFKK